MNRHFFGGYYLSEDGVRVFGCRPYHAYQQGMVDGKYLLYCLFSELSLDDDPTYTVQESADMALSSSDYFFEEFPDVFDGLTPYVVMVIDYDLACGRTEMEMVEQRGFLLHPSFAGKTFAEVCIKYPVAYVEVVDEEGNVFISPSHWKNSQE
jgi:hypothetical protein